MVLREAGQLEQALKHMEKHKTHMLDKSSWLEIQGDYGQYMQSEAYFCSFYALYVHSRMTF